MGDRSKMAEFKHIVRIANTDLDGRKPILHAMQKIKGVGFMISNLACSVTGIDGTVRSGELSDDQIYKLDNFLKDPRKFDVPSWLFNRRKDMESGEDKHILTADLDFTKDADIKRLKMIKSNRGLRHQWGLPVRGQRTKANFRRSRGKTSLGVKRKKAKSGRV